jgi:hypothetical protein
MVSPNEVIGKNYFLVYFRSGSRYGFPGYRFGYRFGRPERHLGRKNQRASIEAPLESTRRGIPLSPPFEPSGLTLRRKKDPVSDVQLRRTAAPSGMPTRGQAADAARTYDQIMPRQREKYPWKD